MRATAPTQPGPVSRPGRAALRDPRRLVHSPKVPHTKWTETRGPVKTEAPFAYAQDDPVDTIDPLGLSCGSLFHPHPIGCAEEVGSAWQTGAGELWHDKRLPDYVNFNIGAIAPLPLPLPGIPAGVGVNITVTRDGHIYVGLEGGTGIEGLSASLEAGWIDQVSTPSACQLSGFVGGNGLSTNGYVPLFGIPGVGGIGPAGGYTWGQEGGTKLRDFATNVGIGLGAGHQVTVMQGYNWRLPFLNGPRW